MIPALPGRMPRGYRPFTAIEAMFTIGPALRSMAGSGTSNPEKGAADVGGDAQVEFPDRSPRAARIGPAAGLLNAAIRAGRTRTGHLAR